MDTIRYALSAFIKLLDYKYNFVIAHKKKLYNIELTFEKKDFYHLAGLQYLIDIDIPKTTDNLFEKINADRITDAYLENSVYYEKVDESYANVKRRIWGLQFIEKYLDNKNLICKYVKYMNRYSKIEAEYLIKSTLDHKTAYIFIRKRKRQNTYCICSFFIESETEYNGIKTYWIYKSKINNITGKEMILYNRLGTTGE